MTAFSALSGPLALLDMLVDEHPDLPAINVLISRHAPHQLQLDIHNDLAVFEQWREALGFDTSAVRRTLQSADTTQILSVSGTVADCRVQLTSYSPNLTLVVEAVAA